MDSATQSSVDTVVRDIAERARAAAYRLAVLPTTVKNAALEAVAQRLETERDALIAANEKDLTAGEQNGLSSALLDRLRLTPERIAGMADGVRQVAALPDPVGEEISRDIRPNGIDLRKVRVPIGVIGIIYESRPNVTIDCAVLCLKSGNASILRGGREAFHSNTALAALLARSLDETGVPAGAVQLIPTVDRAALNTLLRCDDRVDCIIPRGGESLIRFVAENARMPVIKHYEGVCCIYVDAAADRDMAVSIAVSAKASRPAVCNAAENLFIAEAALESHLPAIAQALAEKGVELRADEPVRRTLESHGIACKPATEEDYHTEYLDLILAIKTVADVNEAIAAVNTYGSRHSDAIVTADEAAARRFLAEVDSATVYWNASTRFTDGFEFGLGAEIGISTDKLHARGPMGLHELTIYKYLIYGTGQVK